MKINSVDFNVVTQFCYFPKDNISSQASHHGPRRYSCVPFGQGARAERTWEREDGAEWPCGWRAEEGTGTSTESWDLFLVLCEEWYGFHAFQLGHSGFFHFLEILEMVLERGEKTKKWTQEARLRIMYNDMV